MCMDMSWCVLTFVYPVTVLCEGATSSNTHEHTQMQLVMATDADCAICGYKTPFFSASLVLWPVSTQTCTNCCITCSFCRDIKFSLPENF